ncbi:MAG: CPBP family intramembrane glutamate endopeptidase, partial [Bradyrhizobium sp.]|nr:CPBP family intramembrane glutamate endopeptidase [Bradyrhizobium sp.]
MDSPDPAVPPIRVTPAKYLPRIWKFWGTTLWGLFIFAALFAGQILVVAWMVFRQEGPFDMAAAIRVVGGGLTISLSVIMGMPAALAAIWIATRRSRTPFAEYLALRWPSWRHLAIGIVALVVLVGGWDLLTRAL